MTEKVHLSDALIEHTFLCVLAFFGVIRGSRKDAEMEFIESHETQSKAERRWNDGKH